MGIEEEYPKGVCKECYLKSKTVRPLMQIGGKYQCPDCSSKHNESSGLVNNIKDPGHEAFVSGKLDSIKPEFDSKIFKEVVAKSIVSQGIKSTYPIEYNISLDNVYNYLHNQPVVSLPHAKQLLKLKKKVLDLKNSIQLFLDQK